jgi:hypothetical protein
MHAERLVRAAHLYENVGIEGTRECTSRLLGVSNKWRYKLAIATCCVLE